MHGSNVLIDRYPLGQSDKIAPVEDQFLRDHIQLSHELDDTLVLGVGGYLWAATEEVENRGVVALIQQTRKQFVGDDELASLAGCTVELTVGPVASGVAVKYLDANEATQTLASTEWSLRHGRYVYFKTAPTSLAEGTGTVWIEYTAGYGTSADAVPAIWKSLICQKAMRLYDYRGSAGKDSDAFERMFDRQIVAAGAHRGYA